MMQIQRTVDDDDVMIIDDDEDEAGCNAQTTAHDEEFARQLQVCALHVFASCHQSLIFYLNILCYLL